ncbi:uncharacterized protein F5891DRAFT_1231813 [Suillus fuscotomentosus]|uniref:Uncharacterized protein n=1 Tax=Suillus fuscotomentosus TaxID=1912939 RepID=A0AAD4E7K3_9AGAM|nr:uncharacterized protein F5891DRAFT_1231813 [Suillus fuscotomentosus]KAG1899793.1 hypothetical protein F5891DRAFT_1231813 [Suillus fuscotomentosus]
MTAQAAILQNPTPCLSIRSRSVVNNIAWISTLILLMILTIYLGMTPGHLSFLHFFDDMRIATEHWLEKPGVRETRNEKAHIRAARNRARKKRVLPCDAHDTPVTASDHEDYHSQYDATEAVLTLDRNDSECDDDLPYFTDTNLPSPRNSPSLQAIDEEYDRSFDPDESILTMDNNLSCACDSPSLQTLEILVGQWRKEWVSEEMWNEAYDEALRRALSKGEHAVFVEQCAQHASEGRSLLESIKDVVHTHCPCCRERLKYDTILLYDLLVSVTSEVKFSKSN